MLRPLTVALVVCALAAPACAFTAADVRALLTGNALVTVDGRFSAQDVAGFISIARERLTVVCAGFAATEPRRFLGAGAKIVVDASLPQGELLQLAALGRGRVLVVPGGMNPQVLAQMKAYGCPLLATSGGATVEEKLRALEAGEQAVADSALAVRDVQRLISVGGARLHVLAKGFKTADVANFVSAGAIVWVDSSMPASQVVSFAQAGNKRVVVRTAGFAPDALKLFAAAGAQIVFAFESSARERARAQAFEKLHGDIW